MAFQFMFVPLFFLANQIPSDWPMTHGDSDGPQPSQKVMLNLRTMICQSANSWLPFGCGLANGFQIQGGKYRLPIFENDYVNHVALIGPSLGHVSQWYLGNGFAYSLTLGFPELESTIGIDWYPIEGFTLSLSLDPLRRRIQLDWELVDPEECLSLLDPIFAAYWLYYWIESQG